MNTFRSYLITVLTRTTIKTQREETDCNVKGKMLGRGMLNCH